MDNDSSFLEESQKELLNALKEMNESKPKKTVKRWKKLPNDFLKS